MSSRASRVTPTTKQVEFFSDIASDLRTHPLTGALVRVTNEDAIKQALRNLALTDRGERPFQPDLGSDIRRSLFEPFGDVTVEDILYAVKMTIKNCEPRIKVVSVDAQVSLDENGYEISVTYLAMNQPRPTTTSFILKRAR